MKLNLFVATAIISSLALSPVASAAAATRSGPGISTQKYDTASFDKKKKKKKKKHHGYVNEDSEIL